MMANVRAAHRAGLALLKAGASSIIAVRPTRANPHMSSVQAWTICSCFSFVAPAALAFM